MITRAPIGAYLEAKLHHIDLSLSPLPGAIPFLNLPPTRYAHWPADAMAPKAKPFGAAWEFSVQCLVRAETDFHSLTVWTLLQPLSPTLSVKQLLLPGIVIMQLNCLNFELSRHKCECECKCQDLSRTWWPLSPPQTRTEFPKRTALCPCLSTFFSFSWGITSKYCGRVFQKLFSLGRTSYCASVFGKK